MVFSCFFGAAILKPSHLAHLLEDPPGIETGDESPGKAGRLRSVGYPIMWVMDYNLEL